MSGYRTDSGARLSSVWNVNVRQARFHKDGHFFMPPTQYPYALFDPKGYIVFNDEESLNNYPQIRIGTRLNVKGGIAQLAEYRRMEN